MCPLCNTVDETHAHLFFACSFSKSIWDNLKILCKLDNVSCVWAEIVSGISIRVASNSIWSVIQRLVFGAAVYYIWQERNFRLFQKNYRSEETVFKVIVDIVRHKLLGLKIKRVFVYLLVVQSDLAVILLCFWGFRLIWYIMHLLLLLCIRRCLCVSIQLICCYLLMVMDSS
ncbi:reverse transcriptase domain, Reverse transcriptase zinc-binding domain protein [Artemisia annua]|uniref:Reverse transcriptase domain, Reverse transcriptase zinc-binding domain protein n=1 Tax=Artemisia annua TaxID=35608 RepID=A0A2U1KMN4_ARTAN|nr:reverse transcriptase domain, Reverse transcriptase zinc-binding domain protein [Artemisia annua]